MSIQAIVLTGFRLSRICLLYTSDYAGIDRGNYRCEKVLLYADQMCIRDRIATVAFDILYFGAIISTIVIIILDNRNPVKTMAWILILPVSYTHLSSLSRKRKPIEARYFAAGGN